MPQCLNQFGVPDNQVQGSGELFALAMDGKPELVAHFFR